MMELTNSGGLTFKDVQNLKTKAENVQTDLSDIKIQIAKISTALDIFVMDKKVVKN